MQKVQTVHGVNTQMKFIAETRTLHCLKLVLHGDEKFSGSLVIRSK